MPVEDSEEATAPSGPMTAFFAERRTAFAAVARLLDDRRFVPLRRSEISGSGSSYVSSDALIAFQKKHTALTKALTGVLFLALLATPGSAGVPHAT